jgi:hypothetical protein
VLRDARAVLPRRLDDLPPLTLRDPAPEVEGGQREADRSGAACGKAEGTRHVPILAYSGGS